VHRSNAVADRAVCFLGRFLPKLGGTLGCRLFFPEPRSAAASRRVPDQPRKRMATIHRRCTTCPIAGETGRSMGADAWPQSHLARSSLRCPIGFFIFTELRHSYDGSNLSLRWYRPDQQVPRPTSDCSRQDVGNKHLVAAVLHEEMEQKPDWYKEPKKPDV